MSVNLINAIRCILVVTNQHEHHQKTSTAVFIVSPHCLTLPPSSISFPIYLLCIFVKHLVSRLIRMNCIYSTTEIRWSLFQLYYWFAFIWQLTGDNLSNGRITQMLWEQFFSTLFMDRGVKRTNELSTLHINIDFHGYFQQCHIAITRSNWIFGGKEKQKKFCETFEYAKLCMMWWQLFGVSSIVTCTGLDCSWKLCG